MDTNCDVIWKNNITNQELIRNIPIHVYMGDREEAEHALSRGHIVCITHYGDIGFISPYTARAEAMAETGEILIYPDGKVIKKLYCKA